LLAPQRGLIANKKTLIKSLLTSLLQREENFPLCKGGLRGIFRQEDWGLRTGEGEKINNLTNSQYDFTLNYRELFLRLNKN
jgi:hypothetical protein